MREPRRTAAVRLLLRQGISMRTRGWDYLLDAVLLAAEDPLLEEYELYRRTAEKHGVRPDTVQRQCREAAASAASDDSREALPVGELIIRIAAQLRFGAD